MDLEQTGTGNHPKPHVNSKYITVDLLLWDFGFCLGDIRSGGLTTVPFC